MQQGSGFWWKQAPAINGTRSAAISTPSRGARLPEQLAERGVRPEQIDVVVNTHLHFDHCGWQHARGGWEARADIPQCALHLQRGEFEHARQPTERDRASYFPENFEPIAASGQWELIDDEREIAPGVELLRAPGHTKEMMIVRLSGGGQSAVFLADLVPTTAHIPDPWIMGFDLYPLTTLENKKKWLPEIARKGWLALFGHDGAVPAARLALESAERGEKITAVPVAGGIAVSNNNRV